ncbi:MAG: hypothetical protein WCC17_00355 [Candidatus Nitrosopolaris sp.]
MATADEKAADEKFRFYAMTIFLILCLTVVRPHIGDIIAYQHGLHFCQEAINCCTTKDKVIVPSDEAIIIMLSLLLLISDGLRPSLYKVFERYLVNVHHCIRITPFDVQ